MSDSQKEFGEVWACSCMFPIVSLVFWLVVVKSGG